MNMTVRIYPATNGRVAFETVSDLPHERGKFIAGFAHDEADAKRRAKEYAKTDVDFICEGAGFEMHNAELRGAKPIGEASRSNDELGGGC